MADEAKYGHHHEETKAEDCAAVETSDRGLFGFGGKKEEEEKCQETVIATEFEQKVQVCEEEKKEEHKEEEEKKQHEGLLEKLRRSDSSSSSVRSQTYLHILSEIDLSIYKIYCHYHI